MAPVTIAVPCPSFNPLFSSFACGPPSPALESFPVASVRVPSSSVARHTLPRRIHPRFPTSACVRPFTPPSLLHPVRFLAPVLPTHRVVVVLAFAIAIAIVTKSLTLSHCLSHTILPYGSSTSLNPEVYVRVNPDGSTCSPCEFTCELTSEVVWRAHRSWCDLVVATRRRQEEHDASKSRCVRAYVPGSLDGTELEEYGSEGS